MLEELFRSYGFKSQRVQGALSITSIPMRIGEEVFTIGYSYVSMVDAQRYFNPVFGKIVSLLFNKLIPNGRVYDAEQLTKLIENNYVTLNPSAKLDLILEYIHKQSKYDGQSIELSTPSLRLISIMGFNSIGEWRFYLESAIKQALIVKKERVVTAENKDRNAYFYNLTVDGLSRLIKNIEGKESKFCFIAMAFTDEMFNVLNEAITPALNETGFNPYVVSDVRGNLALDINLNSDTTINDAILAGIKKSKFTIADFTFQRAGVYFEAGFALGRNQKVIYTCRRDEMEKTHFDVRNYQHIVWDTAADFKEKLISKIEAFIKD